MSQFFTQKSPDMQRQCGVSHEVVRGAQGASHVALGKSGLHAHCEGERVIALESWYPFAFFGDGEIRADALGKDKVENMLLITRARRQMRRVRPGSPRLRLQHQFPAAGRLSEPRTFPGI